MSHRKAVPVWLPDRSWVGHQRTEAGVRAVGCICVRSSSPSPHSFFFICVFLYSGGSSILVMPTTIHSFPQELIRHTLSLAYPPGAYKFQQGLCLASLVHPSWTEPAVSLVTCIVNFQGDKPKAIQAFLESGPVGRRCHEVKLASVDDAMAQQVVAKFGGVERVHLQARSGSTFDLSVMLSSPACHCEVYPRAATVFGCANTSQLRRPPLAHHLGSSQLHHI